MPPLSPRHIQVLELLDRGAPIKIIAAELDLSTSRVNQLIRELKERLAANHRFALVEAYRQMPGLGRNAPDNMAAPLPPCTNASWAKTAVAAGAAGGDATTHPADSTLSPTSAGNTHIAASLGKRSAPDREPVVVPAFIDGSHAYPRRILAMTVLSALIAAGIVLAIVSAMTLTALWKGVGRLQDVSERRE